MSGQDQTLLYAMVFKDGTDPINTIPLAHAFLSNHTVPSIAYFLGNVANEITNLKKKLVRPSFFVIDFSAALVNSILQAFNEENINTHLNLMTLAAIFYMLRAVYSLCFSFIFTN